MKRFFIFIILTLMLVSSAIAAESDWKLVFEDNFDSGKLDPAWKMPTQGVSVVDGRLRLEGTIFATIDRSFKSDVRLEYDAEAIPGIPPCDISVNLCVGEGAGWGYLLGFGAQGNHANHAKGPGVNIDDHNPPFLIEQGKKYHVVARKEGKQLFFSVNGTTLFDIKLDDPIGGPGFDRNGIMTWTGMFADNVKVYERVTPHPDTPPLLEKIPDGPLYRDGRKLIIRDGFSTPALEAAVATFNSGKMEDALKQFRAMGGTLPGLLGQAYVLGDLAYVEPFKNTEFKRLAQEFEAASKANPKDKVLADYALTASWFSRFEMKRDGAAQVVAMRYRNIGPENNPFYYKARLYEARYLYWNGAEGGAPDIMNEARSWMAELKKIWPENSVLRQYTGEPVPWGEGFTADTSKHPAWAAYLREAYSRDIALMDHFFKERQAEDGQLGGGYGDDVELLRSWTLIAAISSGTEATRAGIERLCQGVWDNCLVNGYDNTLSDVEHSAEPSADSIPYMMLLRYGDPLWIERNMQTCKTIKETYMGIDKLGYPRFMASVFGAGMSEMAIPTGDTGYCGRAMKHFLWSAWQGNPEARDWFVRWADGWRDLTMKQVGDKLPGVVPLSIWWPTGSIFPPTEGKPWWDEKMNYIPRTDMTVDAFLAAYYLSGDKKFLKPFQVAMEWASKGPLPKGLTKGTKEWQMGESLHLPGNMSTEQSKTGLYRWLTGDTAYDEYILRAGESQLRYQITGDLDTYLKTFQGAAVSTRNNLELQTTEVLSTDRAALGAALPIFAAYTGAVTGVRDAATPTFAVTYDTPSSNFAALVTQATKERLRVWLYNFEDKPMQVGLKLWQLKPGSYILSQGEQLPGERPFQYRYGWIDPKPIKIMHKADGPKVMVPPGKTWVVDIRLDEPIKVPVTAPDMAIGKNDITETTRGINVTIHNIGNADAKPFTVALQYKDGNEWKTISEQTVTSLPYPKNFVPSTRTLTFGYNIGPDHLFDINSKFNQDIRGLYYRVVIDPQDKQYEACETNNVLEKLEKNPKKPISAKF